MKSKTSGRKAALIILAIAGIWLQTGCKNDTVDPVEQADPKAIIPTTGKKYTYKTTDSDGGVYTRITQVRSVKDSTGFRVFNIQTLTRDSEEETALNFKAYSQNGITTNEIQLPAVYSDILGDLSASPFLKEFKIKGFPHYQRMENKAEVNSAMTYAGEPIKLYLRFEMPDDHGKVSVTEIEFAITYADGKVVKRESITTPAGTFDSSKWAYGYTVVTKIIVDGKVGQVTNDSYEVEDWTAPGVGIVKSIETSPGDLISTTELQKVD